MAALEAMLMRLNQGKIFSLPDKTRQHMVATLKHVELFADKANWVVHRENVMLPVYETTLQQDDPSISPKCRNFFQRLALRKKQLTNGVHK